MNILLADLVHTNSVHTKSLLIPLNIGYLKSYALAKHGSAIDIQLIKEPQELLSKVYKDKPQIVGLSNYGWNEQLNLHIGRKIRSMFPKTLIVMGGPNIDSNAKNRHAV